MPANQQWNSEYRGELLADEALRIVPPEGQTFSQQLFEATFLSGFFSVVLTLAFAVIRGIYLLVRDDRVPSHGPVEGTFMFVTFTLLLIALMYVSLRQDRELRRLHIEHIQEFACHALSNALSIKAAEDGSVIFYRTDEIRIGGGQVEQPVELLRTSFADAKRIGEAIEINRNRPEADQYRPLFSNESTGETRE